MEHEKLKDELQLAEGGIENRRTSEDDEIRSQLNDDILDDSDWSADESDPKSGGELSSAPEYNKVEQLSKELADLQEKADELKSIDVEIHHVVDGDERVNENGKSVQVGKSSEDDHGHLDELSSRIKQLEAENEELKNQIADHDVLKEATSEIDPEVLNYLEAHNEDLTLDFLEKAFTTLIELKASDPEKDFYEYIQELKQRPTCVTELAELRLAKKEAEIKLQLMKRRYEDELNSFNELKVEQIFKNSGAKEYIERIKEKNQVKEEIISHLKRDLEQKRKELAELQLKYKDSEEQCNVYWKAWKDTQVRKEVLEAEKRATQERDRRALNQAMNLSSASSLVDNRVPTPPPIEVPTVEEILRQSSAQNQSMNPYSMSMNSSIPPPPPIDVPFNEIYNRKSSRSGYS